MSQNSLAEAARFYNVNDLLQHWQDTQDKLEVIKAAEMTLRREVAKRFFPDAADEGTFRAPLVNGSSLKLHAKLNYKFKSNDDDWQANYDALAAEIGPQDADAVVVWKPEVGVRQYKQLTGKAKEIADKMISTTPAAPSLTIEPGE